jgi:phosphoenolpyruvate-protein kinase (PTS system EI component)
VLKRFFHPSVLRAIRQVVEACDRAGRELSVCGEAAGEPESARLFVGLGIHTLSMSPIRAARVRAAIRQSQYKELTELAERSLVAKSTACVKALVREHGGPT